jgi:hypothetical protein
VRLPRAAGPAVALTGLVIVRERNAVTHQSLEAPIYGLIDEINRFAFNVAIEKTDASADQGNQAIVSGTNRQHTPPKAVILKYDRARIIIAAFTLFATLGFVSYAAYAHEWLELSVFTPLGQAIAGKQQPGCHIIGSLATLSAQVEPASLWYGRPLESSCSTGLVTEGAPTPNWQIRQ